jgi:predicted RNA binding protein YcfA (HicA-like mRNA interferase family)
MRVCHHAQQDSAGTASNACLSDLSDHLSRTVEVVAKLLDQRRAIRLLEREGWSRTVGGKHSVKMTKPGSRPITLPHHHGECYSKGLSAAIVKQAELNSAEDSRWNSRSSSTVKGLDIGARSPSFPDASRQAEL